MTERPILFSAAMVRALLAGTKTQTRRIVKPQPHSVALVASGNHLFDYRDDLGDYSRVVPMDKAVTLCPHGKPGERLWVRESLKAVRDDIGLILDYAYTADGAKVPRCQHLAPQFNDGMAFAHLARKGGVPSIHMPRWASRITLEITEVRVQRLQEISDADGWAEGITASSVSTDEPGDAARLYCLLWESINGPGSWAANPWVWAISFKRVTP